MNCTQTSSPRPERGSVRSTSRRSSVMNGTRERSGFAFVFGRTAAGLRHSRGPALAFGMAAMLFSGCLVGPNYPRPPVPTQTGWKEQTGTTNTASLPLNWWEVFNDAGLNALESQAIEANQNLKRAFARVTEARALARVSASEFYPRFSAGGAYSRNRFSENRGGIPQQKVESDDFTGSFDLSYELDIWGKVRRSVEAARADASAVAAGLEVVLLTLTAEVARSYYVLRSLDNERFVMEATIALRRETVRLQESRNQAGLINEVDVTRARTELAGIEAELLALTRSRVQVEHALAVLCGQPPANFSVAATTSNIAPPEIPAGLPSSLLQRRPDIAEAETLLQGASARIGVAQAAFFPTIKLTGAAGLASADLGTLLDWPSRVWSIGPSVHVPIFEGGRNRAHLKATEARFEEFVAGYRGTILNAFREVEDALSDLRLISAQSDAVNRSLLGARDTAALAHERYQRGLSSYLEVVDAQRIALQSERQAAQLRGQRVIATILLAKALGGGWNHGHGTDSRPVDLRAEQ
jgi:multidrug efflux system outer membrane protein